MVLHQINAQFQCSLLQLPLELRNQIYGHFLTNIETTWSRSTAHLPDPAGDGTDDYQCGRIYEEMSDLIYRKLELAAYLDRDNVVKDTVVVAWLMWLKTVLEGTSGPLEKLTLWLCAAQWKLEHKPMAILYAAQGFARIAPTTFHLHCGFSDSMCEDIVSHEAVAEMKKTPGPPLLTQKEEAFENFTLGWNRSLPSRTVRLQGFQQPLVQDHLYDVAISFERARARIEQPARMESSGSFPQDLHGAHGSSTVSVAIFRPVKAA
ncbi:unnamed protein product [Zymoseptoria tritici ST99CH_3D1]|uniref:Uncharacterized protein n=2 Tax=Zymoseptoria tritici TaxID=1047171 RepID=A0A1X7RDW7_ZYMT9|nr:unnamed protein product [Zymoseptoria tritici ST99CH_3D7]SMR41940.1 unnamed protein product [Zymoseptoria tritici ST99CH_1E4]SMR44129.1 unnamed protein product [Zymoseptoria tritici ST99CH_3D1]